MKLSVVLFIFFFAIISFSQETLEDCNQSLKELMKNPSNHEKMKEILKIQGKLTLHRLAWAVMHDQGSNKNFKIENRINKMLDDMDSNKDPEFIKAREIFKRKKITESGKIINNGVSRSGLSLILPHIKDILNAQNSVTDPILRKKYICLLYTSPSPRDGLLSRMPSSA
mgnify:CR=1 FL=1